MKNSYSKITLTAILIVLMLILGMALFLYNWEIYKNDQANHELQIARSVAALLPKDLLKPIEAEPTDTNKTEYQIIKKRLKEIAGINTNAGFTYLYTTENNDLYFITGSEPLKSKDYSPHALGYPKDVPALRRPFLNGNALVTDQWGKWRSVLVPLKDATTGKTIAVFGMDFTVSVWERDFWVRMAGSLVLILIFLLTLLFVRKIFARNRSLEFENNERRELGKSLIEDKERFLSSFYNAPLCYQSLDAVGDIIDVNLQWLDTYGYTIDEAVGKWFGDLLSPSYQDGFRNRFPIFKDRGQIHSEFEMVRKNGTTLFVAFDGKIGYHPNGVFKQAHCILQDITERQQTKNELTSSLSLLNAAFESTADGIIVVDREDKFVFHNQKFADMWNIPKEILTDRTNGAGINYMVSQVNKPEKFLSTLEELSEQHGVSHTSILTLANGRIFEWYAQPQKIGETIFGRVWSFRDITESKLSEINLRESEVKYSSMKANFSDTIVITDSNFTIRYCSPNIENCVGWLSEELIGKECLETVHHDDSDLIRKEFSALIENKNSVKTLEYRFKCKDGNYKPIGLTVINLNNDEFNNGVLITFHEITESVHKKEQLIKAKEKQEESEMLKSAFLANISHDVRIPLNGILGFAELLNEPGLTNEERREYIEIIQTSGKRILDIINDIVKISNVES